MSICVHLLYMGLNDIMARGEGLCNVYIYIYILSIAIV